MSFFQEPRTSKSHPLPINAFPLANGLVGMTLAPGKKTGSSFGAPWDRDLGSDINAIADWGADVVVTLSTESELARMQISALPQVVADAGMLWLHLPFADTSAPDADWWEKWRAASQMLHAVLEAGGKVLIHCRAGLERSAMVAALLQVERGVSLERALSVIARTRRGAGPLPHQRNAILEYAPALHGKAARIRAALIGGAIGDAMGAEIEFKRLSELSRSFPTGEVPPLPHGGQLGRVTDDAQMTLFTAEGLIRAKRRFDDRGLCHPPSVVHHALLRWYVTQGGQPSVEVDRAHGLIKDPRLHARRAPGLTCMAGLRDARQFGDQAQNTSKGCGTVMRMAPVAFFDGLEQREMAKALSYLTHGHETAAEASAAFVDLLCALAEGEPIEAAARGAVAQAMGETSTDNSTSPPYVLALGKDSQNALGTPQERPRIAQGYRSPCR